MQQETVCWCKKFFQAYEKWFFNFKTKKNSELFHLVYFSILNENM